MEKCDNCGRTIGKLETPFLWKESIVCEGCHTQLNKKDVPAPTTQPVMPSRHCPVCGSTEPPIKKRNGSIEIAAIGLGLGILLLSTGSSNDFGLGLFFFVVGIVAAVMGAGQSWICPKCQTKLGKI